jgi:hypothetical protein
MNQKRCKFIRRLALDNSVGLPPRAYSGIPRIKRVGLDAHGQPTYVRRIQIINSLQSFRGRYRALKAAAARGELRI